MSKTISLAFITLAVLSAFSCGERRPSGSSVAAEAYFPIDSIPVTGGPFRLCEQRLTSEEAIFVIDVSEENEYCYDREGTPVRETFFFPEADIEDSELVRKVQVRYNYANVLYRILHGYELFVRKSSADSVGTRKDSLDLIRHDCPVIPSSLLREAIPDRDARRAAERLLAAYRSFDGRAHSGSAFDKAHGDYVDGYDSLPGFVDDDLLADFEEHFWEWYDKRKHVPEYDRIAAFYLKDKAPKKELSEEQVQHFKEVIACEKDIDRRTILTLELLRCSREGFRAATLYLGEILESGIYTKYILEAWLAWRGAVQLEYLAPSSFSIVPNNYYDMLRVKCLNTILRHIQTNPDKYDVCLLENFIYCEILHRMDAIYGNEGLTVISRLTSGMFIQPSALGRDYLKDEEPDSQ